MGEEATYSRTTRRTGEVVAVSKKRNTGQGDLFQQDAPKQLTIGGELEFATTKRNDLTREFDRAEEARRKRILGHLYERGSK